jgi:hypothetical protein
MKQKIALTAVTLMGLALLGYTAMRTLDLIQLTLPANNQTVGYLALVAFDGGLVGWSMFYLHGAHGAWQRALAAVMTVVSLAGVLVAFAADTFYQSAARGTIGSVPAELVTAAIWFMVAVIGANVAAVVGVHLTEPETRRQLAEEEARDKITEAALKQIASNADALAAELAPQLGQVWLSQMRGHYAHELPAPGVKSVMPKSVARPPEAAYIADLSDTAPMAAVKISRNGNGNGAHPKA